MKKKQLPLFDAKPYQVEKRPAPLADVPFAQMAAPAGTQLAFPYLLDFFFLESLTAEQVDCLCRMLCDECGGWRNTEKTPVLETYRDELSTILRAYVHKTPDGHRILCGANRFRLTYESRGLRK